MYRFFKNVSNNSNLTYSIECTIFLSPHLNYIYFVVLQNKNFTLTLDHPDTLENITIL